MFTDERLLLVWSEHDHPSGLVVVQTGENPAVDAKVGVPHVGALDGVTHAEHDAAKVAGVLHEVPILAADPTGVMTREGAMQGPPATWL